MKQVEETITQTVIELVEKYRINRKVPVTMEASIVADLGIKYDTEELVIVLQERTGIKPPPKEWEKIRTVAEVIQLLLKYA